MSFNNLGLSEPLLRAIKEQGYTEPTPVQKQAIPVILSGKDILAGAQTGTGKTAGFTLPMLQLLSEHKKAGKKQKVSVLILTPTRELAAQVAESVEVYGKYLPFKSTVIFGGVKINPQIVALRKGVDIIIATPGRLLDHVGQKTVDLSGVDFLILDEADRMLDMGFINDIRKILAILPKERQNLLFSATFSNEIKKLTDTLLKSPALIEVARRNTSSEQVTQVVYSVDRERKRELLSKLISEGEWKQILVFTRTKHGANRLSEQLTKDGIHSAAIHGNKSQNARTKALAQFKQGEVRVLVATDIAARGIDIDQLPHVVNYELPNVPEDYVHRIGRTGRAGSNGEAISLVCVDELELLANIEKLIKKEIHRRVIKGFEPDPSIKPEPIQKKKGQQQRGRGRSHQQPKRGTKTSVLGPSGGDNTSRPRKPRANSSSGRGR
ncbi:DEAD/DEAH box helicase [bacterium]|nr:DEAD/DEAH box helicase [bacterium]MBU1989969.1 DEAD/DEAH box helicase [bacterium]